MKESPIKYGNCGFLYLINFPDDSTETASTVEKYAYIPSGKSGVIQNLPLFSSRTSSSIESKCV